MHQNFKFQLDFFATVCLLKKKFQFQFFFFGNKKNIVLNFHSFDNPVSLQRILFFYRDPVYITRIFLHALYGIAVCSEMVEFPNNIIFLDHSV